MKKAQFKRLHKSVKQADAIIKAQPKDLPFDELLSQLFRWSARMEKAGADIRFTLEFKPKQSRSESEGKQ